MTTYKSGKIEYLIISSVFPVYCVSVRVNLCVFLNMTQQMTFLHSVSSEHRIKLFFFFFYLFIYLLEPWNEC